MADLEDEHAPSGPSVGGLLCVEKNCKGCGNPLVTENAWMTDGCPCNSPLGVNSENDEV